jgi:hypothetical protein
VKQAMRAADPGFDERRHGNLVEILRSVQRDGLVRLDRDRQGVLRVFQGPQLRLPVAPVREAIEEPEDLEARATPVMPVEAQPSEMPELEAEAVAQVPSDSGGESPAPMEQAPESGDAQVAAPAASATPRRRRKAGTAAPTSKATAARKPRARATTPRKKKDKDTETA